MSETNEPSAADLRSNFENQLREKDRKIALLEAGVDTSTPVGAMFAKGYDGDLTPDAVKAAWQQVAPAAPAPEPTPEPAPTPAPQAAATPTPEPVAPADAPVVDDLFETASTISGQGNPPGADLGPHPGHAAVKDYYAILHEGRDPEEAAAAGLDRILSASMKGDPRVTLDGRRGGE